MTTLIEQKLIFWQTSPTRTAWDVASPLSCAAPDLQHPFHLDDEYNVAGEETLNPLNVRRTGGCSDARTNASRTTRCHQQWNQVRFESSKFYSMFGGITLWFAVMFTNAIVCRLIQEEKDSTEQRAEELENQVSGGIDAFSNRWQSECLSPPSSNGQLPSFPSPSVQRRSSTPKYRLVYFTVLNFILH